MTEQEVQILNHFKQCYLNAIKNNPFPELDSIIENSLRDFGYNQEGEHVSFLRNWSAQYIHWDFLFEKLNQETEEILFIHPGHCQIQGALREELEIPHDEESWQFALNLLALREKKDWNLENPFISFFSKIHDRKFRISLAHSALAPDTFAKAYFRVPSQKCFSMEEFGLTPGQEDFLKNLIAKKANLLVCGPTGSGKTTFMKTLLQEIHPKEHKVIIEDTLELEGIHGSSHLLAKDKKGFQMNDYCQYALRMKPDRIILGEIRGEEVVPFLLSSNTGHKGMISSLHANSAIDAINRLALLFQIYSSKQGPEHGDLVKMICQGIDHIVFMKDKKICEMIEIIGCEGSTPYYNRLE